MVLDNLKRIKEIILITEEVNNFAGNMLEVVPMIRYLVMRQHIKA
jgi:hypothetical protein